MAQLVARRLVDPAIGDTFIDGSRSVDHINCSLVTPVNRQTQSDSY